MKSANDIEFPGATFIGDFTPEQPEWHELRSRGIGGSEIGTIMGLNPWESAYALWAKKSGKIDGTVEENWAIRLGKAFEEPILKLFQEQHPELEVYTCGTFRSNHKDFMHANPDAMAYNPKTGEWIVVEVKTARSSWESVPQHYIAQVQHYMYVMGVTRSIVVAVAGMNYGEYEIEADKFQQLTQVDMAVAFWHKLLNNEKPDWDGSESTYQAVRLMHPDIDNTECDLGDLGVHLYLAQVKADEATEEFTKLKSIVMDAMGKSKLGFTEDDEGNKYRVASRQIRGGKATLIVHRKGK